MEGSPTKHVRLRRAVSLLLSILMLGGLLGVVGGTSSISPAGAQASNILPVVFVHGYLGSGEQYRTQAQRFASNGFPEDQIVSIDYSGIQPPNLDTFINQTMQRFGVSQVYVAAHSLGTAVMLGYLLNPFQGYKVRAYAALDGVGALCYYGTRCTSITAASMGQSHVEASSSAQSFQRQYQHFTGQAPQTTNVVPVSGPIRLGGKAIAFSTNAPVAGVNQGRVYDIDTNTGMRVSQTPVATFPIAADGSFGPVQIPNGTDPWEIAVAVANAGELHFYYQPFLRSSLGMRLLLVDALHPTYVNSRRGPNHSVAVVVRYREFWAGNALVRDQLRVQTTSTAGNQPERNVFEGLTSNSFAGVHLHDDAASPGSTTLANLPYFSTQPFQAGRDVYMPAAGGPNGTIRFTSIARGDTLRPQVINAANWPSQGHGILIHLNDYVQ
jgi:pimeloyl-ACP methyl ester carboxylesterase